MVNILFLLITSKIPMNSSMENYTLFSFGYDMHSETIAVVVINSISLLLDLTCLAMILACRPRLDQVEFSVLVSICCCDLATKCCLILYFTNSLNFNLLYSVVTFSCVLVLNFCANMSLFYLSVFHLSMLKRTPVFLNCFTFTHDKRTFVSYFLICFVVSVPITIAFSQIDYQCLNQYEYPFKMLKFFSQFALRVICQTLVPSVFSFVTYLLATFAIGFHRLSNADKHLSQIEAKKQRRNNIRVFKFLLYAFYNIMSTFPEMIFYELAYFCENCSFLNIRFVAYFGELCFVLQSIVLVLIHKLLRETFMCYFKKIFF